LFWTIGKSYPSLQNWLGLLGALLIFLVVYEIVHEEMGKHPTVSISSALSHLLPTSKRSARHFVIVMSVSWDALLCAPALIPLAESGDWNTVQLGGAFLVFGLMAGVTAYTTLKVASQWRTQHFSNISKLVHYKLAGSFFALSVISGFGVMAFGTALGKEFNLLSSLMVSTSFMAFIFLLNQETLRQQALLEATEAINGTVD